MIWKIGPLTLIATLRLVVEQPYVVTVEKVIKVSKPVVVEEELKIKIPIVTRVDEPSIEVPRYPVKTIDHQIVIHRHRTIEKPLDIEVEVPVVREVKKEIVLERTTAVEKLVDVPTFKVKYGEPKEVFVPLDGSAVIDIECVCGKVYKSSMTKCTKCGRKTAETLRELR